MPEPDTITIWNPGSYISDMDVDGAGNSYLLCQLAPGAFAGGGYVVTSNGYYILKYDKLGNFISGTPLQITYTGYAWNLSLKKDFQNNRYYITGTNNSPSGAIRFGGIPILSSIFIGCFNNSGTFLWQRQNNHDTGNPTSRAVIDAQHNIYITSIVSTIDTFDSYNIPVSEGPVVFKLDTNGNNLWAKYAIVNAATFCHTIILNGNEVDIAGYYPGLLKWPGYPDSLNIAFGPGGYRIFITRFNAITGAVIGLDSLASPSGTYTDATAMTSDKFGNFYLGGDFGVSITVAGTTLNSIGGDSDFFVAKYGTANCSGLISLEASQPSPGERELLRVYPNPATDELNITGVEQNMSYRIISITGIALQQGKLQQGSNTVSMQQFTPGIYILEMTGSDGERNIVRVVKE
jgi:hypothetical protein